MRRRATIDFCVRKLFIHRRWVGGRPVRANGGHKYLAKRAARITIIQRFLLALISDSLQWFYYFGIIEDLILRFSWTLSMSLIQAGYIEGDVMMTILSPLEVFRRFIWNYFRLENEHLNNVGKFRAVRDISVAPLDCSDQVAATSQHFIYISSIYIYVFV